MAQRPKEACWPCSSPSLHTVIIIFVVIIVIIVIIDDLIVARNPARFQPSGNLLFLFFV